MITASLLRRTMDASRLNEIANHNEVRPHMGGDGDGPVDFTAFALNHANICFVGEHACFLCHKLDAGLYEVHSMVLPEGRGAYALECVREGLRYMFCATDCIEIVTRCPDGNGAALGLARAAGFQETFRRERIWAGGETGVSFQSMTLARWRGRDSVIAGIGAWFHEKLAEAKREVGSGLPAHDDDDAHDRAVGASVLMVRAGNPAKAIWAYNRWAVFAGYAPAALLSEAPVLIDIVDAIVSPAGDDMEVVLCRGA